MYSFLNGIFSKWVDDLLEIGFEGWNNYSSLGLTEDEFLEKFINPYLDIPITKWKVIAKEQTRILKDKGLLNYFQEEYRLPIFNIKFSDDSYFDAIDWTILQIKNLNLEGFKLLNIAEEFYREPIKQCLLCGSSFEIQENQRITKRFCSYECDEEWHKIKKIFRQKLKRVMLSKKYSAEEKKQLVTKYFLEFVNNRFNENKKIKNNLKYNY